MEKIIVSSNSKSSSSIRVVYKNSMFLVVQVNSLALTANCRFAAEVKAPICPGIRKISILSLGWYVFRHMHDVVGNNDNQRSQTVSTNGFRELREASRPCSVQGSSSTE